MFELGELTWVHVGIGVLALAAFAYAVATLRRSERGLRALRSDLLSDRADACFLPGPVPAPLVDRSRPRPPHEQDRARAPA